MKYIIVMAMLFSMTTTEEYEYTKASWYGEDYHGRLTASGETYNMNGLSAASKTLPFGTKVEVTNLDNGKTITVPINDRGPFIEGRGLDLSKEAFSRISNLDNGVINVKYKVVK